MTKRILIVDDERHVRTLLEHTLDPLEDYDVELVLVPSGEEALQVANETCPDLAFIDIAMPGMDGYQLCNHLRAHPKAANVQLVLLSELGSELDRHLCAELQVLACITKPFDPERVRTMASQVLKLRLDS